MTELTSNEILTLSGTPYEIGFKHGCIMKEKVHNSIQTYEKMFKEVSNYSWKTACEKAKSHLTSIEKYGLKYIEEMKGIADGSGVRFEDVLTLNARSEVALINSPDGCTSFALTAPKTKKTWLAQNWDWKGTQINSLIHLKIKQKNLPTIQIITEAGIIGKIGFNSVGIGVGLNALVTNEWQAKVPIHIGLRAVLESNSFKDAISKVDKNQIASPAHFLIASKTNQIASMEVSPIHTVQIQPGDGRLFYANHLCSSKMKEKIEEDTIAPNSLHRFNKIDELTRNLDNKDVNTRTLFKLLSNHENYPDSICSHQSQSYDSDSKLSGMETVFSIVMNLSDNELTWIRGKPCEYM